MDVEKVDHVLLGDSVIAPCPHCGKAASFRLSHVIAEALLRCPCGGMMGIDISGTPPRLTVVSVHAQSRGD